MLTKKKPRSVDKPPRDSDVVCTWCGTIIRSNAEITEERMCLICHARMLNDYLQELRKVSDERRTARRF